MSKAKEAIQLAEWTPARGALPPYLHAGRRFEIMTEKRCSYCKKTYPATPEYFSRHAMRTDGFQMYCKSCAYKTQKKRGAVKDEGKNYLYKILKSTSETANRERRADISELIEDYNLGIGSLPGEARELRETDEFFLICQSEGNEIDNEEIAL